MLLSADSLTIIFVKIYCYWTRTVGVIAKGSRGPVFLRHSVVLIVIVWLLQQLHKFFTHVPLFTKQDNLLPAKSGWRSAAEKVTIDPASH